MPGKTRTRQQENELHVLLMWHMHQPDYRHPESGGITLPWVRLHALRSYRDMVELVESAPAMRVTFNLSPSLLDQLEDCARGDLADQDRFLQLARKPAAQLTVPERTFLLRHYFSLNRSRMVIPYPRYHELSVRRGRSDRLADLAERAALWPEQDLRDLQVWFHLAWCGTALRADPTVARLLEMGRDFSETDKTALLDQQQAFLGTVIPAYARAQSAGFVELTASPAQHPILPLVIDLEAAREAQPGLDIPNVPFRWPEDARWQIEDGIRRHEARFGQRPRGMWPPEGALSDAVLPLLRQAGIDWTVTDDEVLRASLRRSGQPTAGSELTPRHRYTDWVAETGAGPLRLFFRDHFHSDLIDHTYPALDPAAAAEDFCARLAHLRSLLPPGEGPWGIPIVLDGENPWDRYPGGCHDFLRALYTGLHRTEGLRASTFSEFVALTGRRPGLPRLRAGSWQNGALSSWIGHPAKNRAWIALSSLRHRLSEPGATADVEEARRRVMIAEGSDWFWWYGDDHPTLYAPEFDALFRAHLRQGWRALGAEPPPNLARPFCESDGRYRLRHPFDLIQPVLDGRITAEGEWLAAGRVAIEPGPHESLPPVLTGFWYGFNETLFFLRLDPPAHALAQLHQAPLTVEVRFRIPGDIHFRLETGGGRPTCWEKVATRSGGEVLARTPMRGAAADTIVEMAFPIDETGLHRLQVLEFALVVELPSGVRERLPRQGYVAQHLDREALDIPDEFD